MLAVALILNCVILFPLTYALITQSPGMDAAYGPDSDARRILTCLYATIGVISAYALIQLGLGARTTAVQIAMVLFPMQIIYKLATVGLVGVSSPVVLTNLVVVAVLVPTLVVLFAQS
ncbi:MAG: hypothetical protein ACI9PY_000154 [Ascidiaceihabitans sp.]|jgi:hypothetical protein